MKSILYGFSFIIWYIKTFLDLTWMYILSRNDTDNCIQHYKHRKMIHEEQNSCHYTCTCNIIIYHVYWHTLIKRISMMKYTPIETSYNRLPVISKLCIKHKCKDKHYKTRPFKKILCKLNTTRVYVEWHRFENIHIILACLHVVKHCFFIV